MSDSATGASLQFDRAEFVDSAAPSNVVCTSCSHDVPQAYYVIADRVVCNSCREEREQGQKGLGLGRVIRAFTAGLGVAVAGAIVWWAVRQFLQLEIGIISIFIGMGVGKAIYWGSREKGGWLYQLMAILLTYSSVALNYTPDVIEGMTAGGAATGVPMVFIAIVAFFVAYAVPFMGGASNIIGILIIAFGLFEAWKFTRRRDDVVTGPFDVVPVSAPAPANV